MKAKEFINIICPEHDRSSCSDKDLNNKPFLDEDGVIYHARCTRCLLLDTLQNKKLMKGHKILYYYNLQLVKK